MRSILSSLAKEKGHRVHEMVVASAVEHIVNNTAMQAKATAHNHLAKANRANHGPRVRAKEKVPSQLKDFKVMLLRMDRFLGLQESEVLVVGEWCNWILVENWDRCMGKMAQWMLNLRFSVPSRGLS